MVIRRFRSKSLCVQVAVLLGVTFLISSCSHTLEVKNLQLYKSAFVSSRGGDITIGLSAVTSTPEEERLVMAVGNALKRDGFKVIFPFFVNAKNIGSVDYLVKLTTSAEYKGSGWNFLINFPGFLVWAPAWHGYSYRAIFGFTADITDAKTKETLPRITSPVDLVIRHADMSRTWTELSWLEVGIVAFIGGILFTRYDSDVTTPLLNAVEAKIGDYVGSKIGSALISAAGEGA